MTGGHSTQGVILPSDTGYIEFFLTAQAEGNTQHERTIIKTTSSMTKGTKLYRLVCMPR